MSSEADGSRNPGALYRQSLDRLYKARAQARKLQTLLGISKIVGAALWFLLAAWLLLLHSHHIVLVFVPAVPFAFLMIAHERMIAADRRQSRLILMYEQGLARIEDRWVGRVGNTGDGFLDPAHLYARDLDLFGPASLFELLCTARTAIGEETLANWLLNPVPPDEVLLRQQAIRDLTSRLRFREEMFTVGLTKRHGGNPQAFVAWCHDTSCAATRSTRTICGLLTSLFLAGLIFSAWSGNYLPASIIAVICLAWRGPSSRVAQRAAGQIEEATEGAQMMAEALAVIEREEFQADKLLTLRRRTERKGVAPSIAFRRLGRIAESIAQQDNMILRVVNVFFYLDVHLVGATERWRCEFGSKASDWLSTIGDMEALVALSTYAFEHQHHVFPEFVATSAPPILEAEGLAHPLLPARNAVRNDVHFGSKMQAVILSGPNMAGKSTFLRTIGLNVVLSYCGAPVSAIRLRLSPLQVATSICTLDSLYGGVSRFYAEMRRIKSITERAMGPIPVLFLLDELFSGTNSHDRSRGTAVLLRNLISHDAIGVISTHDLALTQVPDDLRGRISNFHFEDHLENGVLAFDYKLRPGVVETSNALHIMRSMGFDVPEEERPAAG